MTDAPLPQPVNADDVSIFGPRRLTQLLVSVGIGLGVLIFWLIAKAIGFPAEPHFQGSFLQAPASVGALLIGILTLGVCAVLGDFIAGRRWFLAGLFIATCALATWAIRGGTVQYVLLRANTTGSGRNVMLALLIEHLILMAAVAGLWMWLWNKRPARPKIDEDENESRSTGAALLAQVGATLLILLIMLAETSVKKQVMVSVFIAGMGGTALSEMFFATPDSGRWYWIAPLIAGVVGYLMGYIQPAGMEIGYLSGFFSAWSRPLPLDYASLGCAGAILGYWTNTPTVALTGALVDGLMS
jgi:hypothetical protein